MSWYIHDNEKVHTLKTYIQNRCHINDGYIQKCLNAGVVPEVCSWNPKYGDMNDVRKLALSGKAPFKSMQKFFTKFVTVKKVAF